jgi:lipopolysaccharide biosynthesis glycosyltransferase
MNIVYASSEKYARFAYCSMLSLLENNRSIIHNIFLIEEGFSPETKMLFYTLGNEFSVKITLLKFDCSLVPGLNVDEWHGSMILYSKLLLTKFPELNSIEKIIYLDSDTIILDDLSELYQLDMTDCYIAGLLLPPSKYRPNSVRECSMYMHGGVNLINLDLIKKHKKDQNIITALNKFETLPKIGPADETVINYVFSKGMRSIHVRFNLTSQLLYLDEAKNEILNGSKQNISQIDIDYAIDNPCVIHFTEKFWARPWKINSKHPFVNDFLRFYNRTPWSELLEKNNFPLSCRIEKLLFDYINIHCLAFGRDILHYLKQK